MADTSRAVASGETTLLEVETGRAYVWPQGSYVQNARFSLDGRWLVYNAGWNPDAGLGPNSASVYHIDLQSRELKPELLAPGFNPVISSRGDIAYVHDVDGQVANVYVRSADGSIHRLGVAGSTFLRPVWAPDGSYLAYTGGSNVPTLGVVNGTPVVLADADSWTARIIDRGTAGTHGLNIDLSPDGRYLVHGYSQVVNIASGVVQEARSVVGWLDATHYLLRENSSAASQDALVSVDAEMGEQRKLADGPMRSWNLGLGLLANVVQKDLGRPGESEQYVELRRFDGTIVVEKLPGDFGSWSPDNRYMTTYGFGSKCPVVVYDLSGVEVACLDAAATAWGPPGTVAVLRVTRPAEPGPKVATGDIYLRDLVTGTERLLLTGLRWGPGGPCMRWSPDWRWLVADDYCDTI